MRCSLLQECQVVLHQIATVLATIPHWTQAITPPPDESSTRTLASPDEQKLNSEPEPHAWPEWDSAIWSCSTYSTKLPSSCSIKLPPSRQQYISLNLTYNPHRLTSQAPEPQYYLMARSRSVSLAWPICSSFLFQPIQQGHLKPLDQFPSLGPDFPTPLFLSTVSLDIN